MRSIVAIARACVAIAFAVAAFAAPAATLIYLDSPPGEPVGGGVVRTLTPSDGTIIVEQSTSGPGVEITFQGSMWWTLDFVGSNAQPFAPGNYERAVRPANRSAVLPGIDVKRGSNFCVRQVGRFTVREAEFTVDGQVVKLAVDFIQRCDLSSPALRGAVRINSTITVPALEPVAAAGWPRMTFEGATIVLNGANSFDADGAIATYQWQQLSGPSVVLSDSSVSQPHFVAPDVLPSGAELVFRLAVVDDTGLADTDTVLLRVADVLDPRTMLYMNSGAGDYAGEARQFVITTADSAFVIEPRFGGFDHGLIAHVRGTTNWDLNFAAIAGTGPLTVGTYRDAQRAAFASPGHPGMDVYGEGRGCNEVQGAFSVLEITYGAADDVQSLAIDFEQHCDGASPLFGSLRFNTAVPVGPRPPSVRAAAPARVPEAATGRLNANAAFDAQDSSLGFAWMQTGGPPVVIANAHASIATFVAPDVPAGGADLVFRIDVTNALGLSAFDQVTVRVVDAADPKSFVYVHSQPGDYVGNGETHYLYEWDGAVIATAPYGDLASLVRTQYLNTTHWWLLEFEGISGAPRLVPGEYRDARFPTFPASMHPGIVVTGEGRGCSPTGRFTVLEVDYGVGTQINRLAIDFEQHCNGERPALFGSVRFNSAVPIGPRAPSAYASASARVLEQALVTLDASASVDPQDAPLAFAWTQVSGPAVTIAGAASSSPTIIAPNVDPGGADLVFRVDVSNALGLSDSATVSVHVVDAADPKSFVYLHSQLGDYIGVGTTRYIYEWDVGIRAVSSGIAEFAGFEVIEDQYPAWQFQFGGAAGTGHLRPGSYLEAERASFASPGHPGLDVSGEGRGCNTLKGRFYVLEAVYGVGNDIVRFAADFEQHCEGRNPALFGSIRFNSAVPLGPRPPSAYAKGPPRIDEGSPVALDATASVDPQDATLGYAWTQIAGPTATLTGANSATPTFVAPEVGAGGADIDFRVTVTNVLRLADTTTVRVHVRDTADPRSTFRVDLRPGYPYGPAGVYTLSDVDSTVSAGPSTVPAPSLTIGAQSADAMWTASFFAPAGDTLRRGTYANVGAVPTATRAGMRVWGAAATYCSEVSGAFTIREVDTIPGPLSKLAIDFEQYCNGNPAPMYGSIRINSAIPVTEFPFTQFTAATWTGTGNATATLAGGGASCRFDNPRWIAPPPGHGDTPPTLPAPQAHFPHGMFAFALRGCTPGASVALTLALPQPLPPGTVYWKYGPTADQRTPHWYVLPATIVGNTVMFNLVDGGLGDDDLTVNGVTVDAGGPGTGLAPSQGVVEVPLVPWPWLSLLLGLLAFAHLRRRA